MILFPTTYSCYYIDILLFIAHYVISVILVGQSANFQSRWGSIGENTISWYRIQNVFSWIVYTKTMMITLLQVMATNIKSFSEFMKSSL